MEVSELSEEVCVIACITFDLPLYIKGVEISKSHNMNVVCRLGGFHLLMNFMGAVGKIMAASGLSEALETCYGAVTLTHMMTGKAYAKALRGHLLAESGLMQLLMNDLLAQHSSCAVDESDEMHCDPCLDVSPLTKTEVDALRDLYGHVVSHEVTGDDSDADVFSCIVDLSKRLDAHKTQLSKDNRTARLWIQYLYYVNIVKQFLRAERTSDWQRHLVTVSKMLNLFAAAGHRNYAKCARLYLQLMVELPEKQPWLYEQFRSGRHSVRRSDRYWGGLSTDLAIEQVMMRSLKSRGGLTHGRGRLCHSRGGLYLYIVGE